MNAVVDSGLYHRSCLLVCDVNSRASSLNAATAVALEVEPLTLIDQPQKYLFTSFFDMGDREG